MNAWIVFKKELIDALRDRRTLLVVLLSSVAIGPIVLIALSALVAGIEQRAEERTVVVAGIEHAPTLKNFFERQTYRITAAPAGYEQQLVLQQLGDPVLVIGKEFEAELARGEFATRLLPYEVKVFASSRKWETSRKAGRDFVQP